MQTILSGRITPEELYNSLASPLINSNCTCKQLHDSPYRDKDGTLRTYGQVFARLCIDEICATDKRTNPMNEDERWTAAEYIVQTYPDLMVHELMDFTCKVVEAQKASHRGGKSEYAMVNINRYAIMERLGSYVRNFRPLATEPANTDFGLQKVAVPLGARNDYERHHMPDGTLVNGPWDADRCWQDFKRTHNYNFATHSYEYIGERSLEEAIAYWEERPTKEEIQSVNGGYEASIVAEALAFQFATI